MCSSVSCVPVSGIYMYLFRHGIMYMYWPDGGIRCSLRPSPQYSLHTGFLTEHGMTVIFSGARGQQGTEVFLSLPPSQD